LIDEILWFRRDNHDIIKTSLPFVAAAGAEMTIKLSPEMTIKSSPSQADLGMSSNWFWGYVHKDQIRQIGN
jgi:hypothetical protein